MRGRQIRRNRLVAPVIAASFLFATCCKPKQEEIRKEPETAVVKSKCPSAECPQPGSACGPRQTATCDSKCRCKSPKPELHNECSKNEMLDMAARAGGGIASNSELIKKKVGARRGQPVSVVVDISVGESSASVTKARLIGTTCKNCTNGDIPVSMLGFDDKANASGEKCRGSIVVDF